MEGSLIKEKSDPDAPQKETAAAAAAAAAAPAPPAVVDVVPPSATSVATPSRSSAPAQPRATPKKRAKGGDEDSDDDDDGDDDGSEGGDSGLKGSEKKSGRRKINIEFIEDKSRRHITFSKRKAGIMKKAYELSTLTGTQVLLLVASETGHVYTFATPKLQPLITKPEGKNLIQACLNAPDVSPAQQPSSSARMYEAANDTMQQQQQQQVPQAMPHAMASAHHDPVHLPPGSYPISAGPLPYSAQPYGNFPGLMGMPGLPPNYAAQYGAPMPNPYPQTFMSPHHQGAPQKK